MSRRTLALTAAIALMLGVAAPASARNINADNLYGLHVLFSDVPGLGQPDSSLKNGWGISHRAMSPWWVSNNGTDTSTLYNTATAGQEFKVGLTVTVPDGPTGQVANTSTAFAVDAGDGSGPLSSLFIFANENGAIYGWNGKGTDAILGVSTPGAKYFGLAIGGSGSSTHLYAGNFHTGKVDVFDGNWMPVNNLAGDFTDPTLPAGYAPFGIQGVGNTIYVAYAKQDEDAEDEVHGEGFGYVSAFNLDGTFAGRVASAGDLNAPWGIAQAPDNFGKFSGDLLVGNFGDGRIHAFKPTADGWEPHGLIKGTNHRPIAIDGLWGIGFGNGFAAGPTNTLFFAAGPNDETEGLFGSITVPQ